MQRRSFVASLIIGLVVVREFFIKSMSFFATNNLVDSSHSKNEKTTSNQLQTNIEYQVIQIKSGMDYLLPNNPQDGFVIYVNVDENISQKPAVIRTTQHFIIDGQKSMLVDAHVDFSLIYNNSQKVWHFSRNRIYSTESVS